MSVPIIDKRQFQRLAGDLRNPAALHQGVPDFRADRVMSCVRIRIKLRQAVEHLAQERAIVAGLVVPQDTEVNGVYRRADRQRGH